MSRGMKLTLLLILAVVPGLVLAGTTGKIAGRVVDKDTGDPLPAVNVVIMGTTMGAATDLNGEYFILNVPVGKYSIRAEMIGYDPVTITDNRVSLDLTTTVNFELKSAVVGLGQEVVIVAERPLIQKDLTSSRTSVTADEIRAMPLEDIQDVVGATAGFVEGHARGGRSGEVIYQVDGMSTVDPWNNGFDTEVPEFAVEELSVITGGMSAEYSNAQSGIVNIVTREGGAKVDGRMRYRTSDFGNSSLSDRYKLKNLEFSLGGPEPITNNLFGVLSGKLNYFLAGELSRSSGRFDRSDSKRINLNGKFTFRPGVNDRLSLGVLYNWERFHGIHGPFAYNSTRWRYHKILERTPTYDGNTLNLNLNWTHTLSKSSLFEVKLSRYYTYFRYNIDENIDERKLGKDLNGNGILDPPGTDLFVDENENGYIDASEDAYPNSPSQWMPWEDVVIGNDQDSFGWYIYGPGGPATSTTFYRLRWNTDRKETLSGKATFTSQVNPRHKIKLGIEATYYDVFDHDVDLASGGNVYGQNIRVFPHLAGFFAEDKMEFEGLIVNAGLRFDYFNPNFSNFPSDLDNPVVDEVNGGEVLNPKKVDAKYYWSPRLGIAHPITERDVMYFNYGRYFQIPRFSLLFENTNWDFSGAFPRVGNADIEPETTYSYEVGLRHQFSDEIKVELTAYYKDIQGLTDTQQIFYTANSYYSRYLNIDYGNIRGFEVNLYKRQGNYFGGSINYTYGLAKGKSSSSTQNYRFTWASNIIPHHESFLDWDQRHTVNANISFRIPQERRLFGIGLLDDMGMSWIVQYGSGLPYTPPKRTREVLINTERRPYTLVEDLLVDKRFSLSKRVQAEVLLWIDNVFNRWNVREIADVDWYQNQDSNGDGAPDLDPRGKYRDPTVFAPGRTIRFGFGLLF